ncbi:MAG: type II toxin-antitoxin system Phd/YefM family antitoxin [Rhodospirillaceae bacterium]|nr:type II toxin-antitoxin system Phd/YefM family antitoxin [Rhodospirillaceae bacterium]
MKSFAARTAKNGFGRLLDSAQAGPVAIEKHGRRVAVVLSAETYDRLQALEDAYWSRRATLAEKDGLVGKADSARLIQKHLAPKRTRR